MLAVSHSNLSNSLERVGAAIRSARILRQITQKELADAVGLSRPTVVAAESGRSISSQNLIALFEYLGVRLVEGVGGAPVNVRRRPRIGELVSAERTRRQRLLVSGDRASGPRAPGTVMSPPVQSSVEASGRIAPTRTRPRIGGLMAAERLRQVAPAPSAS